MDKIKEIEKAWKDGYGMELSNDVLGKIFSHIHELEAQLHKAAGDISFWREQQADSCQRVIELEAQLKLEKNTCVVCWGFLEPDGSCITCRLERRVKELEVDLKLNASMLAKQTDLTREAEIRAMGWRRGNEGE